MALTNILREPRRELIEQGMGAAALAVLVVINLGVAELVLVVGDGKLWVSWSEFAAADFVGILLTGVAILMALIVHALGEKVCAVMARHGRDPRPTQRYT